MLHLCAAGIGLGLGTAQTSQARFSREAPADTASIVRKRSNARRRPATRHASFSGAQSFPRRFQQRNSRSAGGEDVTTTHSTMLGRPQASAATSVKRQRSRTRRCYVVPRGAWRTGEMRQQGASTRPSATKRTECEGRRARRRLPNPSSVAPRSPQQGRHQRWAQPPAASRCR